MHLTTQAVTRVLHEAEITGAAHKNGSGWIRVHLTHDHEADHALAVLRASGFEAVVSDILPGAINVTGVRVGRQAPETLRFGDEIRWQQKPHAPRYRIQIAIVWTETVGVFVQGLAWLEAHPERVTYLQVNYPVGSMADVTRRAEMPVRP